MKLKFINCPACSANITLSDPSGKFTCPSCGHNGFHAEEVTPAVDVKASYEAETTVMQGLKYTVDIVMCVDATASMKHLIDQVKNNATKFYDDLKAVMEVKGKIIDNLRVKVIAYRDFWADGKNAIQVSEFFNLPGQRDEFNRFVSGLRATGGGNLPENGLEALATAFRAEWATHGDKKRYIVVLWTDASTHPLEKDAGYKPRHYPPDMPRDLNELTDMWEDNPTLLPSNKRLILYAPDKYAWSEISAHWSNTIQYPSTAGYGLSSLDYQTILDAIANSV